MSSDPLPNKWVALWREVRRRHVIRATIGYIVVIVAGLQAADVILPALVADSDTIMQVLVIASIVGLPVTIGLAWVYDLTPWGPKRTLDAPGPDEATVVGLSDGAPEAGTAGPRSIAVLPFLDRSAQRDQEYFAEGVAEELINQLARTTDLSVAARTSSFSYRGEDRDIREIGYELNVEAVLEGSVRKAGGRLRIYAQLVLVRDGYQIWSERYDRDEGDIFAIQDEIARQVCDNMNARYREATGDEGGGPGTDDVEAYSLYLQGRHLWTRRHRLGLEHALSYYQRATEADPRFALPWAGIADVFTVLGIYSFMPEGAAAQNALAAARRGRELGPRRPEAHITYGRAVAFFDWKWEEAEEHHGLALRLDPKNGESWANAAQLSLVRGRVDEALERAGRASEFAPDSSFAAALVGEAYLFTGAEPRAAEFLEEWRDRDPEHPPTLYLYGEALASLGRFDEAVPVLTEAVTITHRAVPFVAKLANILARAGRTDEAEELLRELERRSASEYLTPLAIAMVHAGLGQADLALDHFERGMESDPATTTQTIRDTCWRSLHGNPRWSAILGRMGLEPITTD